LLQPMPKKVKRVDKIARMITFIIQLVPIQTKALNARHHPPGNIDRGILPGG